MVVHSRLTDGWPVWGQSRRLNVLPPMHVTDGSWPTTDGRGGP